MRDPRVIFLPPHVSPYADLPYVPPTDAQYEAMWRERVKANEERRKIRAPVSEIFIPAFLRRQAD